MKPKKMKSDNVFIFLPSICHAVMGPEAMILVFCMLSFKPAFSFSFTFTASEVKGDGREELSHVRALGRQLGGDTLRLRLGAAAGRTYPTSKNVSLGLFKKDMFNIKMTLIKFT